MQNKNLTSSSESILKFHKESGSVSSGFHKGTTSASAGRQNSSAEFRDPSLALTMCGLDADLCMNELAEFVGRVRRVWDLSVGDVGTACLLALEPHSERERDLATLPGLTCCTGASMPSSSGCDEARYMLFWEKL